MKSFYFLLGFPCFLKGGEIIRIGGHIPSVYTQSVRKINNLKNELFKKYGKPYMENYNVLKAAPHGLGTFWKTKEKVVSGIDLKLLLITGR